MSVILICVLLQSARQLELPAGTLYWLFCETLKLRAVCLVSSFARFATDWPFASCYWACMPQV